MAELSVKASIVKVLLCDLVSNRLTPPGVKNNRILILLHIDIFRLPLNRIIMVKTNNIIM